MNKRFDEVERLQVEIANLEKKLKAAKEARSHLEALDPAKLLATMLHDKFCRINHTDGCSWGYESGYENCWTSYAHAEWLAQAEEILTVLNRQMNETPT